MEVDNSDHHQTKRSRINCTALLADDNQLEEAKTRQQQQQRMGIVTTAAPPWPTTASSHHPSSRIYRVSRATGGKDRHSKVYTAKGIRDRRVRLSVSTAIAFYDLQDRLGFDQPSKAIEWLIKAASAAIDKLPSLDGAFLDPSKPLLADDNNKNLVEPITDEEQHGQQQQLTKSGCSSTSETSKGSVLSLSRSENRVKARVRARERANAKDKEKDITDDGSIPYNKNVTSTGATRRGRSNNNANSNNATGTFTQLLTGITAGAGANSISTNGGDHQKPNWLLPAADYLGFLQSRKPPLQQQQMQFSPPTAHYGNIATLAMSASPSFNFTGSEQQQQHNQQEMQQFSFLQDHLMPATAAASPAAAAAGDYNLNFSIASGLMGVNNRGTLQSNSQQQQQQQQPQFASHHHQLQRLSSSPLDGPNIPFFFSTPPAAAAAAAAAAADGQFFDGRLQLWDGFRHADIKEKGKN